MKKKLTMKQKIDYIRMGLSLVGITTNQMGAELIVKTYEMMLKKGGDFNIYDAAKIEMEVTGKYKEKEVTAVPKP